MTYPELPAIKFEPNPDLINEHQYEALRTYLGEIGIVTEVSSQTVAPNPEQLAYDGPIVNRQDFLNFAKSHGLSNSSAGVAWYTLARAYDYKVSTKYWSKNAWYKAEDFQRIPLVYGYAPAYLANQYNFQDRIGDLHLDSIHPLLKMVNDKVRRFGPQGIKHILGPNATKGSIEFLKLFAKEHPLEPRPDQPETS